MPKLNENELQKIGFSLGTIEWFRSVNTIVQPGTISLDVTELEALQHEFRLVKNRFDALLRRTRVITSTITANYTTRYDEVLICQAELTVTLNTVPRLGEFVTVKRDGTGIVTVSGTIDGDTSYVMLADHESKTFRYNGTEWSIE